MEVLESDTIQLEPVVSDEDGDQVTVVFEAPFDKSGVWETDFTDAGVYEVLVVATDGQDETRATIPGTGSRGG